MTKEEISGIIGKQISEGLKEIPKKSELKKVPKKLSKSQEKCLTKEKRYGIIDKLSQDCTLANGSLPTQIKNRIEENELKQRRIRKCS